MEKYDKIKLVCKIEMGDVFLVEEKTSKQKYIMKRIFIDDREQQTYHPENEAKLLEQLDHPNIIKMQEHFYHKKYFCLIMEFAEKGDLNKLILKLRQNEEYLNEKQVLDLFCQLCLAVKYLHDRKYIHRDIKIHNIFLSNENIVKLGDFGISIQLDKSEIYAKTQLGTPYYLSPEVVQGKHYDQKVDIWMIGCFLYEICELARPFQGATWSEVDYKIQNIEPESIDESYSQFLQILVKKLLQKDPQLRPSINEILEMPEIIQNLKQMSKDEVYSQHLIFPQSIYQDEEENEHEKTVIKDYENYSKVEKNVETNKKNQEEEEQLAKYSLSYLLKKAAQSVQKEEMLLKKQKQDKLEQKKQSTIQSDQSEQQENNKMNQETQSAQNLNNTKDSLQVKKNKFQQKFYEKKKQELNICTINGQEDEQQNIISQCEQTKNIPKNASAPSTTKLNLKQETNNSQKQTDSFEDYETAEIDLPNHDESSTKNGINFHSKTTQSQTPEQNIEQISQNSQKSQNIIDSIQNKSKVNELKDQSQEKNNLFLQQKMVQNSLSQLNSSLNNQKPITNQEIQGPTQQIVNTNPVENNNSNDHKVPSNGQPTTKQNQQSFSFSANQYANLLKTPQLPNTILFTQFLKEKLGKEKFTKMKYLLESSSNPLKLLDENTELITEIIGPENIDCINYFRCLITSSVTPPGSHFRARSTANSPCQTINKNLLPQSQHGNQGIQAFSIHLKSANFNEQQQHILQLQKQGSLQQQQQQNQIPSMNNNSQYVQSSHQHNNNNNLNNSHHFYRNQSFYSQHSQQGQMSVGNSPQYYNNNSNKIFENNFNLFTNSHSDKNQFQSEWSYILSQPGNLTCQNSHLMNQGNVPSNLTNRNAQFINNQPQQQTNFQIYNQQQQQFTQNKLPLNSYQLKQIPANHKIASTTLNQNQKQMFHSSHFYQQ
ncbi:hypothetical protein ABPG74_021023 [Tetrahymena malaccensis]